MKKTFILLIVILGLINVEASGKWFQQKTIYSKALQQEKTYYVGLPKGYNPLDTVTRYPVIVFLHGASISATDMVNSLEPFLDNFLTKLLFDKLFKVIFVIPDGSCGPYKGSFYTNSSLYGNYEDFIIHDMMDEIADQYHTHVDRAKWSLMGHSMGGYGAMKIALKYPQKFIGVSSLSGPVNITYFDEILPLLKSEHGSEAPYDFSYSGNVTKLVYSMAGAFSPNITDPSSVLFPVTVFGQVDAFVKLLWEKHNPINFVKTWKGNPAMAVHTYCGELDEFKLAVPNKMFSDTLDKYKIPHLYRQDPTGDHVNSLFTSLPQGINFLYQVMDTAQVRIATKVVKWPVANSFSISPNPANDRIFISGTGNALLRMVLRNLSGQILLQKENLLVNEPIEIRTLKSGMYLISLQDKNGNTSTIKIIKQ